MSTLFIFMIAYVVFTGCDAFFADAFPVMKNLLIGSGTDKNSRVLEIRWRMP